jgi:acyl-CoA synthetase (NDP forming)
VMFGQGGVNLELYKDVTFRFLPITDADALEMIGEIRAAPLLHGFRGSKPLDTAAVVDVIKNVACIFEFVPEIESIDINPLLVFEHGCKSVDLRIMLVHA